ITIAGSLGHISKPLAQELVQKGHTVTVISSKAERQQEIEASGAKAAIGNIQDADFLATAFTGADAIYTMLPPPTSLHDSSDPNFDMMAVLIKMVNNYTEAIQKSGVKRVVHLSSIGAHMEKDSGIIVWAYKAEELLNKLQNVNITFMRPVGFYYNLLSFIPVIKNMGVIASNYGADDVIPWVSPLDIAGSIAEEIVKPLTGRKVLYVASEELSCNEVATMLGTAIGKPDLKWVIISDEQLKTGMEKSGMPKQFAEGLVEMNASLHNGKLLEDYCLHKPTLGKTKLTEFAQEFAAAYNKA